MIYACDRSLQSLLSGKYVKRLTVTSEDPLFKGGDRSKGRRKDLVKVCRRESFQNIFFCSLTKEVDHREI